MIWHPFISVSGEAAIWREQILARAADDARIIVMPQEDGGYTLAFTGSVESAGRQREIYEASGEVSPSLSAIFLRPEGVLVNREGTDDSVQVMIEFVIGLLKELPVAKVVETDTNADITKDALSRPEWLFAGLE